MKIAILGGGLTGLTAAHYLSKKEHNITLFEKESVLGGLTSGFKENTWDWSLERTYHHLFINDKDILSFAKEIGFDNFIEVSPETASLFEFLNPPSPKSPGEVNNYRTISVDTPQDFIRLPMFNLVEKIRAGIVIAGLKLSPPLSIYEKITAKDFLIKSMGERVWIGLWEELFRKKFGKYAENILASFIWARIKKRTKKLIYIKKGFQNLIDYIEKTIIKNSVVINKNSMVLNIKKRGDKFIVGYLKDNEKQVEETLDAIISTIPTPALIKTADVLFPRDYSERLKKIKYLHAVSLIVETEKPVIHKTYWLNINVKKLPFVGLIQHTNMIDKKHYGGRHLLYVANYVDDDSPLLKINKEEVLNYYLSYLKIIANEELRITNFYFFKAPWSQPVFDKNFLINKPGFETPVKNFYIADLDMTYPYDRGTNYAVKLGKEVAKLI